MNIYIEWVVIIAIMITFIIGILWIKRSQKKALKEYDPEKDLSRKIHDIQNDTTEKGGFFNTRTNEGAVARDDRTSDTTNTTSVNPIGYEQLEGRELLPKADVSDVGENSNGSRKNSSSIRRRIFGRKNRK